MDKLPISVVVVAKNAEGTINGCLSAVQRNNPAEIIVVDGKSGDRTIEIARRYTKKIYSDEGKGLNFARQLGAEQSSQEYLAYVDSDAFLTDGALETMFSDFINSEYISMRAREVTGPRYSSYWQRVQYEHNQLRGRKAHLGTVATLLRRETILRYGFDLHERDLDDVDLELRLRAEGYEFGISSARYYHHYRADFKSVIKYRFFLGKVTTRYIRKYGPRNIGFWPPLTRLYWLGLCLIKGKPHFIPYLIIDWVAETAGMIKGFFELVGEAVRKTGA